MEPLCLRRKVLHRGNEQTWLRHQSAGRHQSCGKGWHSCECEPCLGCWGSSHELKCPWAQSLMRRMKFVKCWGSTQVKVKLSVADIAKLRKSYVPAADQGNCGRTQLPISAWHQLRLSRCQTTAIIKLDPGTRSRESWNWFGRGSLLRHR